MNLFLILYFLEGTIRKYLFQSQSLILVKYIPLFFFLLRGKILSSSLRGQVFFLSISSIPLFIVSLIHYSALPIRAPIYVAMYDSLTLWFIPIITISVAAFTPSASKSYFQKSLRITYLFALISTVLIVFQSIAGPSSLLNLTVAGDYEFHRFGEYAFKASGLFSIPNPFIIPMGLISVIALYNLRGNMFVLSPTLFLMVSLASIVFNLSSRTYILGSSVFVFIILASSKHKKEKLYQWMVFAAISIAFFFSISYLLSPIISGQNFEIGIQRSFQRSISADDPLTRIYTSSLAPLVESLMVAPIFGGAGLGSTANFSDSDLKEIIFDSHISCSGYLEEGEVSRIICSFGFFGLLTVVFFRFFPSVLLFKASQTDKESTQNYNPALLISSLVYALNFLPLKTNDIYSGLIAFILVSKAIRYFRSH